MLDADIVMGLVPNASILIYVAPNTAPRRHATSTGPS